MKNKRLTKNYFTFYNVKNFRKRIQFLKANPSADNMILFFNATYEQSKKN